MLSEKHLGKVGRYLTPLEQEVVDEYDALLEQYHEKYKVKWYDPVSVHEAFPELKAAFEKKVALHTYYRLRGGVCDEDYNDNEKILA